MAAENNEYLLPEVAELCKIAKNQNKELRNKFKCQDLVTAHNNYKRALIGEIKRRAIVAMGKERSFCTIDYDQIMFDSCGYSPNTILYGIWNPGLKTHDRTYHSEVGIPQAPVLEIKLQLKPLGYTLTDISDSRKSKRKLLRIDFGDMPPKQGDSRIGNGVN